MSDTSTLRQRLSAEHGSPSATIMSRAGFILPSALPLDYTHRVAWTDAAGNLHWQWCSSEAEALRLAKTIQPEHPNRSSKTNHR